MCLAIPGKIISVQDAGPGLRTGKVEFGRIRKEINLSYVPEAEVGEYVIVHVGFAISRLEEKEAQRVFEYLSEMEGLDELEVPNP